MWIFNLVDSLHEMLMAVLFWGKLESILESRLME